MQTAFYQDGRSAAAIFMLLCLLCCTTTATAQTLEPRSYTNLPVGETFLVVGASRSEGDVAPTPASPLQDLNLTIDGLAVGMAHSFALAGKSSKIEMVAGRACYEGDGLFNGERLEGRRCEYTDPLVKMVWNFYGAPAMGLADFRKWLPGVVVGASLQAGVPLGSYTSRQLINAGTNRWMLRPGLGLSWAQGRWHLDLSGSMRLFEDNDEFYTGIYLEQDPLYQIQGHIVYYFPKGRWLALNGNFFWGGETTKDGVASGDRMENTRWGITFSMPFNAHHSLKVFANVGGVTRIGGDFDSMGLAWQYRF